MERELTVRHVFVGFVEGKESGIRSPECGIRNRFLFVICGKSFRIYNIFSIKSSVQKRVRKPHH